MRPIFETPNQIADPPATGRESRRDDPPKSRFVALRQGAIVFVVLFVTLYTALR